MEPRNFRGIYDRHQGPYGVLTAKRNAKGVESTGRVVGSALRAQATHEMCVKLVTEPGEVTHAFVFSDVEGQFIGALYKRGEAYAAWEHLPLDDEPVRRQPTTLAKLAKQIYGDQADVVAPPKTPKPPKVKTPGFPAMRGKALVMNTNAGAKWPASPPAQMVKKHFEDQGPEYRATAPELVASIGAALTMIGVAFPASLISRLKQAGLLREDAGKASTTEDTE